MSNLYPDPNERAYAYLAEGAAQLNALRFGEGVSLSKIEIVDHEEEGYLIQEYENWEELEV